MKVQYRFQQLIGLVLMMAILAGCGVYTETPAQATPPATETQLPATEASPTELPATDIPPIEEPSTAEPATATPTAVVNLITEAQDLVGTWFGYGSDGMYQRFNEDGTCQTALELENLDLAPNVECTYHFEGERLTMTTISVSGLPPCPDTEAVYEVQSLPNGNIKFIALEDSCAPRRRTTAQEHEPVR